jgi:hypothetical protein
MQEEEEEEEEENPFFRVGKLALVLPSSLHFQATQRVGNRKARKRAANTAAENTDLRLKGKQERLN